VKKFSGIPVFPEYISENCLQTGFRLSPYDLLKTTEPHSSTRKSRGVTQVVTKKINKENKSTHITFVTNKALPSSTRQRIKDEHIWEI
jgi:hypothetical protein